MSEFIILAEAFCTPLGLLMLAAVFIAGGWFGALMAEGR